MNYLEKYWKLGAGVVGAAIVVAAAIMLFQFQTERKEMKAQEELANLEIQYNDFKNPNSKSKVDINNLKQNLEKYLEQNTATVGGQIAALYLSDVLTQENKATEALDILKKVQSNRQILTSYLVLKKIGQLQSDMGQCDAAIKTWDQLLNIKKADFTKADIQINQALCYQKMNNLQKAEEILNQVKNDKSDISTPARLEAEKILRLIKFKKNNESSAS